MPPPPLAMQGAREFIQPKQHSKRLAIKDIIDVEEGGRPQPSIILTLSNQEKGLKAGRRKRENKQPKLIKGLMGKQRRGNFLEYL